MAVEYDLARKFLLLAGGGALRQKYVKFVIELILQVLLKLYNVLCSGKLYNFRYFIFIIAVRDTKYYTV